MDDLWAFVRIAAIVVGVIVAVLALIIGGSWLVFSACSGLFDGLADEIARTLPTVLPTYFPTPTPTPIPIA